MLEYTHIRFKGLKVILENRKKTFKVLSLGSRVASGQLRYMDKGSISQGVFENARTAF